MFEEDELNNLVEIGNESEMNDTGKEDYENIEMLSSWDFDEKVAYVY